MSNERKKLKHGVADGHRALELDVREEGALGVVVNERGERRLPFLHKFSWVESPELVADLKNGMSHDEAWESAQERLMEQPRFRLLPILGTKGRRGVQGRFILINMNVFPDSDR